MFRFRPEQLRSLFPFHTIVGPELRLASWSPLLEKLLGGLQVGQSLADLLILERPGATLDFGLLLEKQEQLLILRVAENQVRCRGQAVVLDQGESILLLLSPFFANLAAMQEHGLELHDLAPHDTSAELFLQLELQQAMLHDLRQARAALSSQNQELDQAQRLAKMGSCVWTQDAFQASRNLSPLVGLPSVRSWSELVALYPAEEGARLAEALGALSDEQPEASLELERNNRSHCWRLRWRNARGSAIVQDVTEQKQTESELREAKLAAERASQSKSEFLAMMSHEVRTPLNGILGFAELLLTRAQDPQDALALSTIQGCGKTLLVILNDILDYSRIESGKMPVEDKSVAVADLIAHTQNLLAPELHRRELRLEVVLEPGLPRQVRTDPTRLQQLLFNLIGNAAKFTPRGGIQLRLGSLVPGRLDAWVQDEGIGIHPERLESLFEPFVQAECSTTRKYGGTGLGLAICKRLCQLMGGGIEATSQIGQGSTFHFWIEAPACSASPAGEEPVRTVFEAGARSLSTLVVEDNEVNRRVVGQMLSHLGVSSAMAEDGLDALDALRARAYELIVVDVEMPRMDGLELIRRIRAGEAGQQNQCAYLVSLTAQARESDRLKCISTGADDFLTKPVGLTALKGMLARRAQRLAG